MNDAQIDPETRALAALFRAGRGQAEMSQTRLAEITGIPQSSLSRKLKGRAPITLYEASLISKALDMDFTGTLAKAIESAASATADTKERYGLAAHQSSVDVEAEQETTEQNRP